MPAGDLLVRPGDIEWEGHLISASGTAGSEVWVADSARRDGWERTWSFDDLPTEAGVSPGRGVPDAMYPSVLGIVVETAVALLALEADMDPGAAITPSPLAWWDEKRDRKFSGLALPRRFEVNVVAPGAGPHAVVDLQWVIPAPGDITVLP